MNTIITTCNIMMPKNYIYYQVYYILWERYEVCCPLRQQLAGNKASWIKIVAVKEDNFKTWYQLNSQ